MVNTGPRGTPSEPAHAFTSWARFLRPLLDRIDQAYRLGGPYKSLWCSIAIARRSMARSAAMGDEHLFVLIAVAALPGGQRLAIYGAGTRTGAVSIVSAGHAPSPTLAYVKPCRVISAEE
jgi:hypothetical protein